MRTALDMIDDTDRRRLLLALLVTLIAVPAFLIFQRSRADEPTNGSDAAAAVDDGSTDPGSDTGVINPDPADSAINPDPDDGAINPGTVETPPSSVPASDASARATVEAPSGDPIFMDGPSAGDDDGINEIAVPAQSEVAPIRLSASYRSSVSGTGSCLVQGVASGLTVTIANLANNRSITCVTSSAPTTQRDGIVLHTETFEQLADLTEAPIFVEVRQ